MTTAPAEHLSNALPPVLVAVRAHRVLKARADAQLANSRLRLEERAAIGDGVPLNALRKAMLLLEGGADRYEREQQEMFTILSAMKCAVHVELPTSADTTTDVSPADRRLDIFREGYAASVRSAPREAHYHEASDDVSAWLEGYDAFAADLAAFEITEHQKRGGK